MVLRQQEDGPSVNVVSLEGRHQIAQTECASHVPSCSCPGRTLRERPSIFRSGRPRIDAKFAAIDLQLSPYCTGPCRLDEAAVHLQARGALFDLHSAEPISCSLDERIPM